MRLRTLFNFLIYICIIDIANTALRASEEVDLSWVEIPESNEKVSLDFGNKYHNSNEFNIQSAYVFPDDSQRTHKILIDVIARTRRLEIRSIINNNYTHHVSARDAQQLLAFLSKATPRRTRSDWPLGIDDDIYIVLIDSEEKEYIMSWDTPLLLWYFEDASEYKNIVIKYWHSKESSETN